MIREKDLQEAIAECQGIRNPNANTCMKLAAYYTIQDHISKDQPPLSSYSYAAEPSKEIVTYNNDTEFAKIIKGMDIRDVLAVMDELMTTIQIVNPRLYRGVLNKLLP